MVPKTFAAMGMLVCGAMLGSDQDTMGDVVEPRNQRCKRPQIDIKIWVDNGANGKWAPRPKSSCARAQRRGCQEANMKAERCIDPFIKIKDSG